LYRGREKIRDRFSWTGLSYSLAPNVTNLSYEIGFEYRGEHSSESNTQSI
jgi:hypothetical protein